MSKLELYRQEMTTLVNIEKFLTMCKQYGIKKMVSEVDEWMSLLEGDEPPVQVDAYMMTDADNYMFAHGHPKNLADVSVRLREVKTLLKTRRLRSRIHLIQVKKPFQFVYRTPFRRGWDDKWKSILLDADDVQICKFDLPFQQKVNYEYDIGTAVADQLNWRTKNSKYAGIDMPNVLSPSFEPNDLDIYFSTK